MKSWSSVCLAIIVAIGVHPRMAAESDLDALMARVLTRRDENWKKLQQYVLDERELIELNGPDHTRVWGEQREFVWFLRDGYFIRSPINVNGVTIGEAERSKVEDDYLRSLQRRDRRMRGGPPPPESAEDGAQPTADNLIRQVRQPDFISSAYFLRFKIEPGRYALAAREVIDGREALKIEYYPARLFTDPPRRGRGRSLAPGDEAEEIQLRRMLNKVALVTLWVDPLADQIVKYTFDNVAFDFLPASWLLHLNSLTATMTMGRPFTDVWLPRDVELDATMTTAVGQFGLRYRHDYSDYRRADVTTKVHIPKGP